jgi:hypothetical protein
MRALRLLADWSPRIGYVPSAYKEETRRTYSGSQVWRHPPGRVPERQQPSSKGLGLSLALPVQKRASETIGSSTIALLLRTKLWQRLRETLNLLPGKGFLAGTAEAQL